MVRDVAATSFQTDCRARGGGGLHGDVALHAAPGPSITVITSASEISLGRLGQGVAAGGAAGALHQAGPFELQQNLHEEPRRNAVRLGDVANPHRLVAVVRAPPIRARQCRRIRLWRKCHSWAMTDADRGMTMDCRSRMQMSLRSSERLSNPDSSLAMCTWPSLSLSPPVVCRPHSVLAMPLQRPARSSSPNITARVQGQQPMLV